MTANIEIHLGDIFTTESDILVIPCSTSGIITAGIRHGLLRHGLPLPDSTLVSGEIRPIPVVGKRWSVVCFAGSVDASRSSIGIIKEIGQRLGQYTAHNRHLRTVVAPLLGSGTGGLASAEAATALIDGFKETAHPDASLAIRILNREDFDRVAVLADPISDETEDSEAEQRQPFDARQQSTSRNAVFISYSHADAMWLKRLRVHLKPLERDHHISVWDDTRINPGSNWRDEIRAAISHAKVAVLLVSADFLASDFIATDELPPLLRAAEQEGAVILPVVVSPCRFTKTTSLSHFQAVNDPAKPLKAMSGVGRERVLSEVADAVELAFR